jgi:hypothetical protein
MSGQLDHHHRTTAHKIFGHPLNHNIQWHDVISLLERFGEVHETHRGNWAVSRNGEVTSFGTSRGRDLNEDQVMRVRHFLQSVGVNAATIDAA